MEILSNRLRMLRKQKKLSQQEIAEMIGVTRQAYSHYELGRRNPDYKQLVTLCDFYGVSLEYLLGRSDEEIRPASPRAVKFALFGGDDEITDAMYEEVLHFADFIKERERKKEK